MVVAGPLNVGERVDELVGGGSSGADIDPSDPVPIEAALIVHRGDGGGLTGVTLLATQADEPGGKVLFIPVGTMVEVPGFGLDSLSVADQRGGLPLLTQSIENLLGVRMASVDELTPAGWTAAVAPAGAIEIDLTVAVESVTETGRVEVLFPSGPSTVEPEQVAALLDAPGQQSQLERLVRHQAFWQGWLSRLGDDPNAVPGPETPEGVRVAVPRAAEGSVVFAVLPVSSVGTATGGEELYQPDRDAVRALVVAWFPDTGSSDDGGRIRVQVLNGVGAPAVASTIQPALTEAGAEVVLSGNADRFDYATSQIVYYDTADRAAAETIRAALGQGELVLSRTGLDVVDVTVVVGADLVGSSSDGTGAGQG